MREQSYFEWIVKSASVYVESATECSSFEQVAPDMDEEEGDKEEEEERTDKKKDEEEDNKGNTNNTDKWRWVKKDGSYAEFVVASDMMRLRGGGEVRHGGG